MSGALFVYTQEGERYALVKGYAREFLQQNGIPAMWSNAARGWHVRTERVPDLVALAERDGFRVRLKGKVP